MSAVRKTKDGPMVEVSDEIAVLVDTLNRLTFVLRDELRFLHGKMDALISTIAQSGSTTTDALNALTHAVQGIRNNLVG